MSSSSLRQHQRKSAINTSGHSPLARNHSVGAPPSLHHSSSTSVSTNRSYRSLPSPGTTTTTTTTTAPLTTTNILLEDDDNNNQLVQQSPNNINNNNNNNNIFSFENRMNNFHNSSFHHKPSEKSAPHSTRLLCGSLIPLQNSSSISLNIDHRLIENENLNSSDFHSLLLQKLDIKYRSFSFPNLAVFFPTKTIINLFSHLGIWDVTVYESLN